MSYESDECKLLIDEAIHDYLHDDTENEMAVKDWFYDLRKQAAKADEYEAKAKAYDEIRQVFRNNPGVKDEEKLWNIYYNSFKVFKELESGEYDAKE